VLDKSALYGGSQESFAAGLAACGGQASSKKVASRRRRPIPL